jgi:autotransporter passenger strand-loop-strand repeat protein
MVAAGGQQYIGSGGTAIATLIYSQGAQIVFGSALGAFIFGTQYDFDYASGGSVYGNGFQEVEPGAVAIGMTVLGGGQQYLGSGGTAIGTQIMSQGAEVVHGTDLGGTISGTQYVFGSASGTVVDAGGYQLVSSGGTISGASISGGGIELTSGASDGAAPITFTGAGELILDASTSFSGTVAGFGSGSLNDHIDLADIGYVGSGSPGATTLGWTQLTSGANASGMLSVSGDGQSANITLFGQYIVGNFTASADGHGGTLVTDPPVATASDANPTPLLALGHA